MIPARFVVEYPEHEHEHMIYSVFSNIRNAGPCID
jgi:hypothetical protein